MLQLPAVARGLRAPEAAQPAETARQTRRESRARPASLRRRQNRNNGAACTHGNGPQRAGADPRGQLGEPGREMAQAVPDQSNERPRHPVSVALRRDYPAQSLDNESEAVGRGERGCGGHNETTVAQPRKEWQDTSSIPSRSSAALGWSPRSRG